MVQARKATWCGAIGKWHASGKVWFKGQGVGSSASGKEGVVCARGEQSVVGRQGSVRRMDLCADKVANTDLCAARLANKGASSGLVRSKGGEQGHEETIRMRGGEEGPGDGVHTRGAGR